MSLDRHLSAEAHRIGTGRKLASGALGLLALCALAPAAFLLRYESSDLPSARSARVSLAGLDLSSPNGARDAGKRIREAARDLCARNLSRRSLDLCADDLMAAAQRQIKARTTKVSLADLDLSTPQGVQAARDRLQATARRVCQELQSSRDGASTQYSACIDETFAHALRQANLLQRISVDF
jgi:UrcA family protein